MQKTFYNPAQNAVEKEAQNGINGEMDRMEKWFLEAQNEGGAVIVDVFGDRNETLYVSDIPLERSKTFVKHFLRDNIPNAANICVPVNRVSGTIKGSAVVELRTGANVKDVLKRVKGLKMSSRRLKITAGSRDDNYRPSTPFDQPSSSTPIRMQSPVMFEK